MTSRAPVQTIDDRGKLYLLRRWVIDLEAVPVLPFVIASDLGSLAPKQRSVEPVGRRLSRLRHKGGA